MFNIQVQNKVDRFDDFVLIFRHNICFDNLTLLLLSSSVTSLFRVPVSTKSVKCTLETNKTVIKTIKETQIDSIKSI